MKKRGGGEGGRGGGREERSRKEGRVGGWDGGR